MVSNNSVSSTHRSFILFSRTYIQVIQGYDSEDALSGWMDMKLVKSGEWNKKFPLVTLSSATVYLKIDNYLDVDEIQYYTDPAQQNKTEEGFGWYEMFIYPNYHNDQDNTQSIARHALSVIASFISHCDNFDGNQGLLCLNTDDDSKDSLSVSKTKDSCKHTPFIYIHDVGGTLGYGWNLRHKNFWPNYFDLQQVSIIFLFSIVFHFSIQFS